MSEFRRQTKICKRTVQSPTNLYNEFTGFNNFLLATTHSGNTGSFTRKKLKEIQEDKKDATNRQNETKENKENNLLENDDLGENRKVSTAMQHHRPTLGNYKAKPTPRQTIQELMFGEENEPLKEAIDENIEMDELGGENGDPESQEPASGAVKFGWIEGVFVQKVVEFKGFHKISRFVFKIFL